MSEIKQEIQETSRPNDRIQEGIDFNINQFEVIDAYIETGKEEPKILPAYPVLD